ncbi:MAG TPA: Zn-dependent hydrolase [Clostridia bacterium]|nr:Zn-dependent hydrolase [Clostridia bacterium]
MKLELAEFLRDFEAMADIGKTPEGGCERLSLSDEDMQARQTLTQMLLKEGLAVEVDSTGAIWARLEGDLPNLPAVLVGSHIDTVRNGGKYDGLLGVMLGFQALRQMKRSGAKHKRAIELVVFPTEESARFNYPTVGSKLLAGRIEPEKLKEMVDKDGVSLYEALISRGFDPAHPEAGQKRLKSAASFFELHIEQGPVLENSDLSIGVVSAIAAPTRLAVEIRGEYAHSGACPMFLRRNALTASAEFILAVERIGIAEAVNQSVAAVTLCELVQGSMNVVPGHVKMAVDIRGIHTDSINRCVLGVERHLRSIADLRGVRCISQVISSEVPVPMSDRMICLIRRACGECHIKYKVMPSGAGHDAMNVASVIDAGMIFIPCKDGVSHNPAEAVANEHIANGFAVLYTALLEEANRK